MLRRLSVKSQTPGQIFKRFLDFIHSSMWDIPISTFIEQKSLMFDRENGDPTQHEPIHKEYADLVDALIGCFCDDLGITGSQFAEALSAIEKEQLNAKTRATLEPVMAAQDIDVFVPMMCKKNIELQLQALQMIEFMCGLLPSMLSMEEVEEIRKKHDLSTDEMDHILLVAVIRKSKEEYDEAGKRELDADLEAIKRFGEEERKRLEEAQRLADEAKRLAITDSGREQASPSTIAPTTTTKSPEKANDTPSKPSASATALAKKPPKPEKTEKTEKTEKVDSLSESMKAKLTIGPLKKPIEKQEYKREQSGGGENEETSEVQKSRTPADINALLQEPFRIGTADLAARAEYLRMQRDQIIKKKREERERKLQLEEAGMTGERPRTARAARDALNGETSTGKIDEDVIKARKTLAEKLKSQML
ncbi:unnamed protein product, partial [Mesorhabditis belari]|uniref:Cilia- and flagella-associated protein 36 n=1 Tax=Mesorhabditis belari TaxID=2138241 RepID=A0AAF3F1Q7_9BILA